MFKAAAILGAYFLTCGAFAAQVSSKIYIDKEEKITMKANQPTEWIFEFIDNITQLTLEHFHPMHEKLMHLMVISEDLSEFAHIHPTYIGSHSGLFSISVNLPSKDPDNQDVIRAVSKAGNYFLYSEMMPMNFPMLTVPHQIISEGTPSPKVPLVLDPVDAKGRIVKYYKQNGAPGTEGDDYRVTLKVTPIPHCGTTLLKLTAVFDTFVKGTYLPVTDLQKWLGLYGHGIFLSQVGTTAFDKTFRHVHAISPLDEDEQHGPEIVLMSDNHGPMNEGVYKLWVQLKRQEKVFTFPFVFNFKAAPKSLAAAFCSN